MIVQIKNIITSLLTIVQSKKMVKQKIAIKAIYILRRQLSNCADGENRTLTPCGTCS